MVSENQINHDQHFVFYFENNRKTIVGQIRKMGPIVTFAWENYDGRSFQIEQKNQ